MKENTLLLFFYLLPIWMLAQTPDYAGPDQTACQGAGATIGNANPGNVCYTWEMADGLNPADIHSVNPLVHPQTTTTYTVHVTGANFGSSTTDQVKVVVDFGGLVITPSYVNLAGSLTDQAQATLNINSFTGSPDPVIWSIENVGTTNCAIDQDGKISGCNQPGTVTVRATNGNYPSCYAEKELDINGGIKDVTASDNANEGRIAHHDDTLYLVGPSTANLTAVPNENSSFPDGQPSWTGPFQPPPGNEYTWNTPSLSTGNYHFEVGEIDPKNVTIVNLNDDVSSISFGISTELLTDLISQLKGNTVEKDLDPFCTPPLQFGPPSFLSTVSASYKTQNSVKYKDPGHATKEEASIDIPAVEVTGCMFFPCCSGGVKFGPSLSAFYFTYFKASMGIGFSIAAVKDPNTPMPEWTLSNLSVTGTGAISGGLRLEANVPVGFGAFGEAILSSEITVSGRYATGPPRLEWNAGWGGLVGKVSFSVWYGSMDNAIGVSEQRTLIAGSEVGWKTLYQF